MKLKTIKISSGIYRNKILNAATLPHTRPTKAILKQSLFNALQHRIQHKIFIECFAGYGSVGFEALSRGAREIHLIEKDMETFKLLSANAALFKSQDIFIYHADLFDFLEILLAKTRADILYFDPPFDEHLYHKIFNFIKKMDVKNILVIFECDSSFNMPNIIGSLKQFKYRKFGRSALCYYKDNFLWE